MNENTESKIIAKRVRDAMKDKKVSQHALARKLGVTQTTVYRRLNGEVAFSIDMLVKIADILETPLSELLKDNDQPAFAGAGEVA